VRLRPLLGVAAAAALAHTAAQTRAGPLELFAPAADPSESALPLLEVKGHAGGRTPAGHDVVIAIDLSASATAPSGHDLDGDGPDGRTSPALLARIAERGASETTQKVLAEVVDLEDSVLFAELLAAQALIDRLDPRSVRIGIVVFSERARVVAPLGSRPEALRRVLGVLREEFWRDLRGTDFGQAVRVSLAELRPDPAEERPGSVAARASQAGDREASILLLSDGAPTLPPAEGGPQQSAVHAAQDAAVEGVRVYTFALGGEAEPSLDIYRAMAATTGGSFERIEQPGDAIGRLRRVDLADLAEVRVENLTNRQAGRALRTFPDGSFDAFLPLDPGENRLRVTAVSRDGSTSALERSVRYRPADPAAAGSDALRAQQEALLGELRRRTREVELWAEIERGRTVQLRELELGAEPAPD
jgi:hypothetical protein